MPSSFATGTPSLFKASITAAIHESFGPGNELEQHSLSSPCGISHRRIRTTDRSAVPRPENRLDREEALPTPSALPASDDSLSGVGSLDPPELERATASTPDSSLGAGGVVRHGAPSALFKEARSGPMNRPGTVTSRGFREGPERPGVRVVSVFSRTLGRLGGRGGPPRRGLNL